MRICSLFLVLLLVSACGRQEPSVIDPRFDELRWTSDVPIDGDLDSEGDLAVVTGRFEPLVGGEPQAEVEAFVAAWQDLLAVSSDQLVPLEVAQGAGDSSVARFGVEHEGLPVFDGYVLGEVRPPYGVTLLVTHVPVDLELSTMTPDVSASEAVTVAQDLEDMENTTSVGDPRLGVFNGGLYLAQDTASTLAWELPLRDGVVFVDAVVGDVIWVDSNVQDALDLELYTADHSWNRISLGGYGGNPQTAVLWMTEDGAVSGVTPSQEARDAFDYITTTHDYFEDVHDYSAIDGDGILPTRVYVHYGDTGYRNAFFSLNALWIGDGANELDVLAHEFTHGVVQYTARLRYAAYAGALNESYADSFAAFIETGDRWAIGEGLDGGPLRRMDKPWREKQPSHWKKRWKVPRGRKCNEDKPRCSIGQYCVGTRCTKVSGDNDWGGVHVNSGIPNQATWLMAAEPAGEERKQRVSRVEVRSIGRDKTADVMMRVLERYLGRGSSFNHYGRCMVSACRSIARSQSYNPTDLEMRDCGAVLNAMHAVGIHRGPDTDEDSYRDEIDVCPDDFDPEQQDSDHDSRGDACDNLEGAKIKVVTRHAHDGDPDPVHIVIDGEEMSGRNKVRPGSKKSRRLTVSGELLIGVGRGDTVWETESCGFATYEGEYEVVYHEGFGLQSFGFDCWRTAPGIEPPDPTEPEPGQED